MKTLSLLAAVLALGLTLATGDAEAKRLGGGKSSGMQRESVSADRSASPAAAPNAAAPGAAAAAQPKRSWAGPLAGLAAGLGLAALASYLGFGEELASLLMIGLLVMAVMVVVGLIMRKRAAARTSAGSGGLQYAAAGAERSAPRPAFDSPLHPAAASGSGAAGTGGSIPADFDSEGFVRNAKVSFIRLQAANDAGNLDDIREFTTPEMFAELRMSLSERGNATQETDVLSIDAQVLDVAEEASRYVVSVRFTGLVREERGAPEGPVDEIWHMVKPRDGRSGWVLAGIQQAH
jgi:predicted lipid-binding transport protein (Tim44 family)